MNEFAPSSVQETTDVATLTYTVVDPAKLLLLIAFGARIDFLMFE